MLGWVPPSGPNGSFHGYGKSSVIRREKVAKDKQYRVHTNIEFYLQSNLTSLARFVSHSEFPENEFKAPSVQGVQAL